ncbi:ABC-2 type transport system ATP-binding protein [Thiohalospira halophila DSM 15071]|uniref:ABC-2 type transport system ATP-binding protein n=1 Tax=Thiohalospira halophila DSM 15071 TaxID=1123397 RepID=A0A1I1UDK8_9GAMM|nr:ABC transporter ATP-binding protein [Thiohalospira halophila]SFD68827.1 ABC-2 type transport system ATP-binding protein [Thiohalospira halophila DSM 15071]
METPILAVEGLVKRYPGGVTAVDGVDLAVPEGICFGLLGPNGAGKTSTVEILEGIHEPTAGTVRYRGRPRDRRFRDEVGVQFQSTVLQDFLTVREILTLFRRLYPAGRDVDELLAEVALTEFAGRDNRHLSGGQRQRLLLACALVNDPALVFLDEPTTGLDPQARRNFWALVERIRERGTTVILTTHYMEEAYVLCDTIAIMDRGQVIAEGPPRELLDRHFREAVMELPRLDLPTVPALSRARVEMGRDVVTLLTDEVNTTLAELTAAGVDLQNLRIRERSLEDLFLHLTGEGLRGG